MHIGDRHIGPDHPPYIIAEIGVNHDGSVDRALELTRAAKDAGADAVKLQLFRADLLMSRAAKLAAYQKTAGESDPVEMLRRLELSADAHRELQSYCHERGIIFLSTPFDEEAVDLLDEMGVAAFKISSGDLTISPLLEHVASKGKPVILSTGMS